MDEPTTYVLVRIKRPDDYDDVHPDLVLEDFLSSPRDPVWGVEIVPAGVKVDAKESDRG